MNRVINFHDVHDKAWFEKVVLLLGKKYNFISADDVEDFYYKSKTLNNACLISVDDGDLTSFEVIYPIMKKHSVPGVFFVSPKICKRDGIINFWFQEIMNCDKRELTLYLEETLNREIGDVPVKSILSKMPVDEIIDTIAKFKEANHIPFLPPQNMNEEHIKFIDSEGLVTIGAHTMTHPFLSSETDERSESEIKDSLLDLENILGHPIRCFAYPNGIPNEDFGKREINILKNTKCKLAFSTQYRHFLKDDDPFSIPRLGISCGSIYFIRMKLFLGNFYPMIKRLLTHNFEW